MGIIRPPVTNQTNRILNLGPGIGSSFIRKNSTHYKFILFAFYQKKTPKIETFWGFYQALPYG